MITVLRKIRKRLLRESKFKSYLLYSIGEILLVVIGILIALQVNNWNTQRKERIESKKLLMRLKADAENDVQFIGQFIKRAERYVQQVDSFRQIRSGGLSLTDLGQIGINRQTYFMRNDTYQEIISSGQLGLIPEEIKTILLEINSFFKAVNKIDNANTKMINEQQLKLGNYFEVKRVPGPNNYEVILDASADLAKATLTYKNYINISYDWMDIQDVFYNQMRDKQRKLIQTIDLELEKT